MCLLAATAFAGTPTDEAFGNLADEYLNDLSNFSPATATLIALEKIDAKVVLMAQSAIGR